MGRNTGPFGGTFRQLDAFGKTLDDVKVKTGTGGLLSLLSLLLISILTLAEFADYRRIHLEPSIVVDKGRGEKLIVNVDITFPRVPCYLLSLDVMDISGEHQNDVHHDVMKTRLNPDGSPVEGADKTKGLKGDLEVMAGSQVSKDGYCGECYGGLPPENGCCNTCEDVREAYVRRGWSFNKPEGIEQCVKEGWTEKIAAQAKEGCRVTGLVRVNKVIGNFHFSPGRSFQANAMHVHDLVPYLRGGTPHDFGHKIHSFSFSADNQDDELTRTEGARLKKKLGIINPLDNVSAHTEESNYMFQYFLKVVSTKFVKMDGRRLDTHQYSVTQYERDLSKSERRGMGAGSHSQLTHGYAGVPGVFFNYEISPMLVIHTETRESLAHFLTDTCAIVGGILTVAGLIDSLLWRSSERIKKGQDSVDGLGFASRTGKWL